MNHEHASGSAHRDGAGRPWGLTASRTAVLALGAAIFVLLLVNAVMATDASQASALTLPTLALIVLLSLATATSLNVPPRHRQRFYALTAVAAGLVTVTMLVGHAWFAGNLAWWIPAALLSTAPFIALALLHEGAGPGDAKTAPEA